MPFCEKCREYFPPNYTELIPEGKANDEGQFPQHCVFCKDGIEFVMREDSHNSGKFNTKYTKQECIADYKAYIAKMKKVADKKQLEKMIKENPFGL